MAESMQTQRRVIDWRDQSDEGLRLRCGELTTQEIRTIRAVLGDILPQPKTIASALQWSGPPVDFREWWDSKDHTYRGDATPLAIAGLAWEAAHKKYVLTPNAEVSQSETKPQTKEDE